MTTVRKASETIFSTGRNVIPMADVVTIEKRQNLCEYSKNMICIVMKGTTWNNEYDDYNNAVFLIDAKDGSHKDATDFIRAWCYYRFEIDPVKNIQEEI